MRNFYLLAVLIAALITINASGQGCMEPASSSGGPQIIGYIQPEFRAGFYGKTVDNKSKNEYNFTFRRARLGLTGSIPYDFSYYVMTEFSSFSNGPYLLDAFVTYNRFKPWFKISIGQFKKSFGLELSTPCQDLYTVDRSLMVNEMASPFRDLGAMISGTSGSLKILGLKKENLISYSLSVTNGTGMNTVDVDRYKDFTGRLVLAPFEWISVGGSYQFGKQKNSDPTTTIPDERSRYGADVQLKKYGFILQAEYISGTDKGSKLVGGGCGTTPELVLGNFKRSGFYSQLMYKAPWNLMPVIKYETYDPDNDIDDTDHGNYRRSSLIFGLNYYPNDWTRIQLNYNYNMETSSGTDIANYNEIPNDMFIMQVQVKLN
jgi:phosphate-selective porin